MKNLLIDLKIQLITKIFYWILLKKRIVIQIHLKLEWKKSIEYRNHKEQPSQDQDLKK